MCTSILWYLQNALSPAFARPCGNLLASRQLVWGTWKSQCQELNGGETVGSSLPRHIDGFLSAVILKIRHCHVSLAKNHVLKLLLAKETGTHSLIQNQMASRYSNFPILLNQDGLWHKCFSVWMWTVILRFKMSAVFLSLYVCVSGQAKWVCRAVELLTCDRPRPYKLACNLCVLLTDLPQQQTLWKPEQDWLRLAVDWMF